MTTPRIALRTVALACAALATVTLTAACGGDDGDADAETERAAPSLSIDGVWARTSPKMATAGAVYLTITNDGDADDALVSAAVDPSVAATTEVHETVVAGSGDSAMTESTPGDSAMTATTMGDTTAMPGDTTMGGTDSTAMPGEQMMTMQPIDRLPVPAGDTVVLEPGGYHIMLLDLAAPLEVGSTVEVTLSFEVSGQRVVTATVGDAAP